MRSSRNDKVRDYQRGLKGLSEMTKSFLAAPFIVQKIIFLGVLQLILLCPFARLSVDLQRAFD